MVEDQYNVRLNEFQKILSDGYEGDGTPLTEERRNFFQEAIGSLTGEVTMAGKIHHDRELLKKKS